MGAFLDSRLPAVRPIARPGRLPTNAERSWLPIGGRHGSESGGQFSAAVPWLGVLLFRRLPRGVVMTESGGRYLARIGTLFDQLGEATVDLQHLEASRVLTANARPAIDGLALADFRASVA